MPNKSAVGCKEQEALLKTFLSAGGSARLSAELSRHLEHCVSCRQYWEALSAVRHGFQETPLYSSALRDRTLRQLASPKQATGFKWLPLVIPAALLSLSISLLIPGWLLSRLFLHWTSSTAAAYGAGYGILILLGSLVTGAAGISLTERGYIHPDNGESCRA